MKGQDMFFGEKYENYPFLSGALNSSLVKTEHALTSLTETILVDSIEIYPGLVVQN